MYQIIEQGTESKFFDYKVVKNLMDNLVTKIRETEEDENFTPKIHGAFVFREVPLKDGDIKNVWIEFTAFVVPKMFPLIDIVQIVIHDEIPDFLLDRFNELKNQASSKIIKENG